MKCGFAPQRADVVSPAGSFGAKRVPLARSTPTQSPWR
jgi:hypothetical protein